MYKSIFILTSLAIGLFSCSEKKVEEKEVIRPVRFEIVNKGGVSGQRSFSGISKSATETGLSFRVGGIITTIKVKEGDVVKKGQLLTTIDDSDAKIEYQKAVASRDNAKVGEETANANLGRTRELFESNNVALAEYEKAKSEYASAQSNLKTATKTEALRKRELGYYKLYAPSNGIIGKKILNVNENTSPGSVVLELESGDDIEIVVGLPSAFINNVNVGDDVDVNFSVFKGKIFTGSIKKVSFVSDETSTYPVTIDLDTKQQTIRPGMSAEVVFNFGTKQDGDAIVIPMNTVQEDVEGQRYVFLVEQGDSTGTGTIKKQIVEIDGMSDVGFKVKKGLIGGEAIVTSGITKIQDGLRVKFNPEN